MKGEEEEEEEEEGEGGEGELTFSSAGRCDYTYIIHGMEINSHRIYTFFNHICTPI